MAQERPMPRLWVIRHGETEWSLSGRHTGKTDIPLTSRGEKEIEEKAKTIVGDGKPIDPKNLCTVFVSPRLRAHTTFHLLFAHVETPHHTLTEDCAEWDYGEYEGLLSSEIKARDSKWSIWKDGCPGGESVEQMQARVDKIVGKVREYHRQYKEEGLNTRDVVIVAHGHFSRVLIARWLDMPLEFGTKVNFQAGGVCALSYNHNSLKEPALNALNLHADVI
ncbi:hypothetical protein MIND_00471300 [Mycena indigotica]|uniref:Phosphoglycerate mutase-like protein n=1 Tax=Mycena indigotica TaxID=2126181 RepID=A0A8H6W8D4_9AGAR|nr:uncharacterized protein MIND_00471300 [Mycena indigotica]KAF7306796.1 hypothetical protein MIND_00471300 [Mycena indigotica]